jgi:hypothetical protein
MQPRGEMGALSSPSSGEAKASEDRLSVADLLGHGKQPRTRPEDKASAGVRCDAAHGIDPEPKYAHSEITFFKIMDKMLASEGSCRLITCSTYLTAAEMKQNI